MVRVRIATDADAESIHQLQVRAIRALGPSAYDQRQVAAWADVDGEGERFPIGNDDHYLVVAERDSRLIGYGHFVPQQNEVRAVYVDPDHVRGGIGSTILAHLEGYANGRGCERVGLWASRNAIEFYKRMGYVALGDERIVKEYQGETVELPVVVMEKRLVH